MDLIVLSYRRGDCSLFFKNKGGFCMIRNIGDVNVILISLKKRNCNFKSFHFWKSLTLILINMVY